MHWSRFKPPPPPKYKSESLPLEPHFSVKYKDQSKYSEEWAKWENFALPYYTYQRKRVSTLPLASDSFELIFWLCYLKKKKIEGRDGIHLTVNHVSCGPI